MANEQAAPFISQAIDALQRSDFNAALDHARRAAELDPVSAEPSIMEGIALSRLGSADASSAAFRRAILLEPGNSKAFYNFAVHLHAAGKPMEALEMARETVRIEPNHASAKQLIDQIEGERNSTATAVGPVESTYANQPPSQAPQQTPLQSGYVRTGYQQDEHSLPWVANLGTKWSAVGWVFATISLVLFGVSILFYFPLIMDHMGNQAEMQKAMTDVKGKLSGISILAWVQILGGLAWTVFDLIDRRGNFLWLVPTVVCSCCGLGFISLPLYMLAGRK